MRIAREGWPFIVVGLVVTAAVGLVAAAGWAVLPGLVTLFMVWFFRDPEREVPDEPGALVSPADGRVIVARPDRMSIFMNVFNVHVCRTPVAGRVVRVEHQPGRFMAAFRDEASEQNERVRIEVEGPVPVTFTLVAGLVARRIVSRVAAGDQLASGDRIGLIRFGSRVDVDLPAGSAPRVAVGDHVVAGETIIACHASGAAADRAGTGAA